MPEKYEENAKKPQKIIKKTSKENHLLVPGGYFCGEKLDEMAKCNAALLRTIHKINSTPELTKEDIYRFLSEMIEQVYLSNQALLILRLIYK